MLVMNTVITGIGCDIVSISRLEPLLQKPRFLEKVYTPREQQCFAEGSSQRAAGIWAAKEAVSKALGTGFAGFGMLDIEIDHNEKGAPVVKLHGGAKAVFEKKGCSSIQLSISHEATAALAFAVTQ